MLSEVIGLSTLRAYLCDPIELVTILVNLMVVDAEY